MAIASIMQRKGIPQAPLLTCRKQKRKELERVLFFFYEQSAVYIDKKMTLSHATMWACTYLGPEISL